MIILLTFNSDEKTHCMTIERFTFTPPFHVNEVAVKLDDALLFAKRQEVPPGFKQDITPPRCRDKIVLRTMSSQIGGREDTVGEIEFTHKITGITKKVNIDEITPGIVIAHSSVIDGGEGVGIDEVIRYIPSIGARHSTEARTSVSIPLESAFQSEAVERL